MSNIFTKLKQAITNSSPKISSPKISFPQISSQKTSCQKQIADVANWVEKSKEPLDTIYVLKHYKKLSLKELLLNPHLTTTLRSHLPFKYFDLLTKKQDNDLVYLFESIVSMELSQSVLIKFFKDWRYRYFKTYPTRSAMTKHVGNILGIYVKHYYDPRNQISFINQFWQFYYNVQSFLHKDKRYEHEWNFLKSLLKFEVRLNKQEWNYLINQRIITYFPDQTDLPAWVIKIFYLESHRLKPNGLNLKKGNLTWKEYDKILTQYHCQPFFEDKMIAKSIPWWFWKKYFNQKNVYPQKNLKGIITKMFLKHQHDPDLRFLVDWTRVLSHDPTCNSLLNPSEILKNVVPHLSEYYICHMNQKINMLKVVGTQKLSPECLDWLLKQSHQSWHSDVYYMISLSQPLTPDLVNKHIGKLNFNGLGHNRVMIEYPLDSLKSNVMFNDLQSWMTPDAKVILLNKKGITAKLDLLRPGWITIPYCVKTSVDVDSQFKVSSMSSAGTILVQSGKRTIPRKLIDRANFYDVYQKRNHDTLEYMFFGPELTIMDNCQTDYYARQKQLICEIKYSGSAIRVTTL